MKSDLDLLKNLKKLTKEEIKSIKKVYVLYLLMGFGFMAIFYLAFTQYIWYEVLLLTITGFILSIYFDLWSNIYRKILKSCKNVDRKKRLK